MLGLHTLDLLIGLAFIYSLLSLATSALAELLESVVRSRARELHGTIHAMIGQGLTKTFYDHPAIKGLFDGSYCDVTASGFTGLINRRRLPSYIAPRTFARALFDLVMSNEHDIVALGKAPNPGATNEREGVAMVRAALRSSEIDGTNVLTRLEEGYSEAMERATGRFKRGKQGQVLAIAVLFTIMLNADTLAIVRHLSRNPEVLAALVEKAERTVDSRADAVDVSAARRPIVASTDTVINAVADTATDTATITASQPTRLTTRRDSLVSAGEYRDLAAAWSGLDSIALLGVPLGYPRSLTTISARADHAAQHWTGLLLTVLAISLGAPFWFDLLSRLVNVRATLKGVSESHDQPGDTTPTTTATTPRGPLPLRGARPQPRAASTLPLNADGGSAPRGDFQAW